MSNSTTQSNCQHRLRVTAIACLADLPGRYPYESAWNIGSSFGSMICLTTVCAIRSDTVGMPSFLVPLPTAEGRSIVLHARDIHAVALKNLLLPVQGKMIGGLGHDHLRQKTRAGGALFDRLWGLGSRLHGAA